MSVTAVTGTDGIVPYYDPLARWTIWAYQEIFTGGPGANRYVPKINDYVIDFTTDEKYIVTDLDLTTMIPVLKRVVSATVTSSPTNDLLMGTGTMPDVDTYRVYLDKSVIPYTLCPDQRYKVYGTAPHTAVFYRGTTLDLASSKVISAMYDNVGNLLGSSIPLETVVVDLTDPMVPVTVKQVPPCTTMEDLPDGEIVTLVLYGVDGTVVSKRPMMVENTGYIRKVSDSQKYITGISLESPFLSSSDPKLIQYPLNVPVNGLNLFGVVNYSDGTRLRMPVDNTKFELYGLADYVATIVGERLPLVLKYNLSPGEACYNVNTNNGAFITEEYSAITTKADGSYSVKLYPYPVWINAINGYRLEWFLMNLDRNVMKLVTPYVIANANLPAFNPINYGVTQRLSVSINLNAVDPTYKNYIHTQVVDVALYRAATDHSDTNWAIGFELGQSPFYGVNNNVMSTFVNQNLKKLKIGMGETTLEGWLNRMYWATKPLFDPSRETQAPTPNMFSLVINGNETEYLIEQWNDDLTTSELLSDGQTVYIKFFKRVPSNDILLSVAGAPILQIN